jgi:DNA polymerase II large subunit
MVQWRAVRRKKMQIDKYFKEIGKSVEENYEFARRARAKGIDPVSEVEVPVATSLAERTIGLISTVYPQINDKNIVDRILGLEKEHGKLDPAVALTVAVEIAKEKFCKFKDLKEAIEAGARIAICYLTLGVVSSPIEGFVELKFGKRRDDGKDYFVPYYSGPIRSAGGTEAAFSVVVLDYLREEFGYARYDPTEEEVKRGVHESQMYHERVTNLQYFPTEKEMEFLMKKVPVQISGDPSADFEVYNYKDLPRVDTNFIRSGFCLVLNEGIALKAPKVLKRIKKLREKGFKLRDWDWLGDFVELQDKIKKSMDVGASSGAVYIKDLVAGRPVFAHPGKSGAFRLRYGRARNTGYSTLAVHPATMRVCGNFIAVGTQLKIEKPTKGCTVASCTEVDGPIVKFFGGEVKKIEDPEEADKRYNEIEEVIYLGDLLVPYGDYVNRNHLLDKPGYNERYWLAELRGKGGAGELRVEFDEAIKLSREKGVSLHPDFIYYWGEIEYRDFLGLLDWLARGDVAEGKLVLPFGAVEKERFVQGKRALELLGVEHKVGIENVILGAGVARALLFNLGLDLEKKRGRIEEEIDEVIKKVKDKKGIGIGENSAQDSTGGSVSKKEVLKLVNLLCEVEIRDKVGTFIGARMGRPEKSKLRKLVGSPHVIFPVGKEGGRLRSVQAAVDIGQVRAEFPNFYCSKCEAEGIYPLCESCGGSCKKRAYCRICESEQIGKCEQHGLANEYKEKSVDIRALFDKAKKIVGLREEEIQGVVKGVRGTSNEDHSCENLAKGVLRAKYGLNVNKDGTIRYDMSEMPLTHFKAKEIGTSIEKLKELGYEKDVDGKEINDGEQVIEIFPHDIILPSSPESLDERADDVFIRVMGFVDDELEKIYGLEKFYKVEKKEQLIGALFGCIAPHICTATVGRLIGFSKTQAFLASPYIHAAMRRDCDGDEAAVILLMDLLINFSKKFLPAHRGGTQDSPLVLNSCIKAGEVDDMIFDLDIGKEIPLEMYVAAEEEKSPYEVKMEQVKGRLGGKNEFSDLHFSYDTEDFNLGPTCSSYKSLPTMKEKVEAQMNLCRKIRAVDTSDVARLVIERHFIRDTRGNLRKFSMQSFRCVDCNTIYRRTPLNGKCNKCGGRLIFTIAEGSIMKYMQPALDLAREYKVSDYLIESLELTEMYIQSIFGREKEKQESIQKWFS